MIAFNRLLKGVLPGLQGGPRKWRDGGACAGEEWCGAAGRDNLQVLRAAPAPAWADQNDIRRDRAAGRQQVFGAAPKAPEQRTRARCAVRCLPCPPGFGTGSAAIQCLLPPLVVESARGRNALIIDNIKAQKMAFWHVHMAVALGWLPDPAGQCPASRPRRSTRPRHLPRLPRHLQQAPPSTWLPTQASSPAAHTAHPISRILWIFWTSSKRPSLTSPQLTSGATQQFLRLCVTSFFGCRSPKAVLCLLRPIAMWQRRFRLHPGYAHASQAVPLGPIR